MAGGLIAKTKPSLIAANCLFSRGRTAKLSSDSSSRSSKGFIDANRTAALLRICAVHQAVAVHHRHVLHGGVGRDDPSDPLGELDDVAEAGRVGRLDDHEEVALVLVGHEARRAIRAEQQHDPRDHRAEGHQRDRPAADHARGAADVSLGDALEAVVEPAEETLLLAGMGLDDDRGERGDSVSAMTPESTTEMAMVIANCW